uniref:Uncharacterized protein n=1 Tax=Rhizophora mucronata TaxID=61149 RepID=A0A2P2IVJ0_RHIMU
MAADVSTLVRILNGYKDDRTVVNEPDGGKSTALITMDLLGSSAGVTKNQSQELDLDLQVPTGWEKRLDLKVIGFSKLGLFVSRENFMGKARKWMF